MRRPAGCLSACAVTAERTCKKPLRVQGFIVLLAVARQAVADVRLTAMRSKWPKQVVLCVNVAHSWECCRLSGHELATTRLGSTSLPTGSAAMLAQSKAMKPTCANV